MVLEAVVNADMKRRAMEGVGGVRWKVQVEYDGRRRWGAMEGRWSASERELSVEGTRGEATPLSEPCKQLDLSSD